MQEAFEQVYKELPEVPMEVDTSIEEQVSKINEAIQGFFSKIIKLESCTIPGTSPEEREKREKMVTMIVENINILEEEYAKLCEEST
jgi:hypothetical protein